MRKSDACPKCGANKDVRAKQCKICRKAEQQSTKEQTRENRFDYCVCGAKKLKRANKCRNCADVDLRIIGLHKCVCGNKKSPKADICLNCYHAQVSPVIDAMIVCTACETPKSITEFHGRQETKHKKRTICKECVALFERRRHIRRKCLSLGIPDPEIRRIAKLTSAVCAICGDLVQKFHIDHCHTTGKFRDLLCSNCNSGLGLFRDNPDALRNAALYVEKHSC